MARDDHSRDQKRLFPDDKTGSDLDPLEKDFPGSGYSCDDESPSVDIASEEERLRNGDIAFRPVSLPGTEPTTERRKGGAGGTALMIVSAIVVVFLLTCVIHTFYSPSPSGPGSVAVSPGEEDGTGQSGPDTADPASPPERQDPGGSPAAMFQAHADLQERYRQSESQIADLEAELETFRAASSATPSTEGSAGADPDRLARLEAENRRLKTGLEQQRRDSQTAISRAEQLVERAESQVAKERGRTRTAGEEADQARRLAEVLTGERDSLRERVDQLESDVARNKTAYDRLTANTTTRLEGESEAVRQLISRHSQELEQEREATREKEAEIQRLKTLIAQLSVTAPGTRSAEPTSGARSGSTGGTTSSADTGVDTAPRILTRRNPEYPVNARRLRVEGTVLLNVLVGIDGQVREVKVLEADGGKLLSPAAVEAVREWTFAPATHGGRAVECWHKLPIRFAL